MARVGGWKNLSLAARTSRSRSVVEPTYRRMASPSSATARMGAAEAAWASSAPHSSGHAFATNKVWKKNGERQRRTEWHRVMVWGLLAERLTPQLHKGRLVYVEGRVCTRTFTKADNT